MPKIYVLEQKKTKKNMFTPVKPNFTIQKWGARGINHIRTCYHDAVPVVLFALFC